MIKPSPTLKLAQRVAEARARGERAFSFSTPTFTEHANPLVLPQGASLALTPAAGLPDLRALVRKHLFGKWSLPESDVIITAGAKVACFSILKAVVQLGETVLIVAPAWPSYEDICVTAGLKPVLLETRFSDSFAIMADLLEAAMQKHRAKVILLANPGNPSGRMHTADELAILRHAAETHGAWIILDESFSNITFDVKAWASAMMAPYPRLAVVNSFSKNYHLQGLRLGAVMLPASIAADVTSVHQAIVSSAPSPSQHLAIAYLNCNGGAAENYQMQRQRAMAFADRLGWQYVPSEGTFYFFPKLPDIACFQVQAAERGVYLLTGDCFGTSYSEYVRFCFGKPMEELNAMMETLASLAKAA